jgi:hypothetical protein
MSKWRLPLPKETPPAGEVNIAFAVKQPGKGRIEYVGPLKEDVAAKILALLGAELFQAAPAAVLTSKVVSGAG